MKKTLTVNLNGRVFNIDEDAYQLLDKYLRNLRIYFRNEEGCTEILADFEARIEELLGDRVRLGCNVISIEEVEKVIAQMGRPDDFDVKEEKSSGENQTKTEPFITTAKKKLYRNPDDKMISGLCSGMAAYFDVEVNLVRIIAVILVFLTSFWIVPLYLIAWIFVPEARTAEQKLEMQGKPITVENIGKTVAAGVEELKRNSNKGCVGTFLDFIVAFFKVGLVGFGCLIGFPMIFALIIVIIVLFSVIFGVGGFLGGFIPWTDTSFLMIAHPALASIAFSLIIGIPLVALVYTIVAYLMKLNPVHKSVKWVGLIIWVLAVVAFAFSGLKINWSELSNKDWNKNWTISYNKMEIQGNGVLADRTEEMPLIDAFAVGGTLDISLQVEKSTDEKTHLLINGDENIIDKIIIDKSGSRLTLSDGEHHHLKPANPILVRLQTGQLKDIELSGIAKVNVSGTFNTEELEADVSGISKLTINDLQLSRLNVGVSGAGEIFLNGMVKKVDYDASGTAKIFALDLVSDTVYAEASGVAFIQCNPIVYFNGEANGASHINYKQLPENQTIEVSGVAKITQK